MTALRKDREVGFSALRTDVEAMQTATDARFERMQSRLETRIYTAVGFAAAVVAILNFVFG